MIVSACQVFDIHQNRVYNRSFTLQKVCSYDQWIQADSLDLGEDKSSFENEEPLLQAARRKWAHLKSTRVMFMVNRDSKGPILDLLGFSCEPVTWLNIDQVHCEMENTDIES